MFKVKSTESSSDKDDKNNKLYKHSMDNFITLHLDGNCINPYPLSKDTIFNVVYKNKDQKVNLDRTILQHLDTTRFWDEKQDNKYLPLLKLDDDIEFVVVGTIGEGENGIIFKYENTKSESIAVKITTDEHEIDIIDKLKQIEGECRHTIIFAKVDQKAYPYIVVMPLYQGSLYSLLNCVYLHSRMNQKYGPWYYYQMEIYAVVIPMA